MTQRPTPAQARVLSKAAAHPSGYVFAKALTNRALVARGWIEHVDYQYVITAAGRAAITEGI